LPPGAIFELKIHQNAFAAGVSPWNPRGAYSALPNPISVFFTGRFAAREGKGEKGLGGMGGVGKGRKGERPPLLLFTI